MNWPTDYLDKIVCGECSQVMKDIPDDTINLVVTSPPYDQIRSYRGYTFSVEVIASELYRVLVPGGVVVWVVGDQVVDGGESGTSFRQALWFQQMGFKLHDTMIYMSAKPPANDNRYQQAFEYMFVFSKGTPQTVNLLIDKKNKWAGEANFGIRSQRGTDGILKPGNKTVTPEYSRRLNVWEYATGAGYSASDKLAYEHPAIFPEALARDHILSWSNEGDIVLDPMCGSSTVPKMAFYANRHFVGIDISQEYVELARKRVAEAQARPTFWSLKEKPDG